jgi:transcriptional regulator with XRE-family HTH domain
MEYGVALNMITPKTDTDTEIQNDVNALCLGANIRKLRQRRSMTLQDVSTISGLSKSLLSQIENESSVPPIPTLVRIAKSLGVNIDYFFCNTQDHQRISVLRKNEWQQEVKLPHNRPERSGYRYIPLAHPTIHQHMEPFWVRFESCKANDQTYYQHTGEEFLYVQEGTLEFNAKGKQVVITSGDSLYFESSIPHMVRSIGQTPASAIAVIYTPGK